jgi:hypothetical protein
VVGIWLPAIVGEDLCWRLGLQVVFLGWNQCH